MEKPHRGEISEQHRQSVLEQLWLTYYNDTLYEQGRHNRRRAQQDAH